MPGRREPTILSGWWDVAVRAFASLTSPVDINAHDRVVEQLARESLIGNAVHRTSIGIRRAWASSSSRSVWNGFVDLLRSSTAADGWRIGGWMIAVVGATALVLRAYATTADGPLLWVVPSAMIGAGLFVMAAAESLSRAAADRRLRRRRTS